MIETQNPHLLRREINKGTRICIRYEETETYAEAARLAEQEGLSPVDESVWVSGIRMAVIKPYPGYDDKWSFRLTEPLITLYIEPGYSGRKIMGHSEVCMHMKVAGCEMGFELLDQHMVQLYDEEGNLFSSPITCGEAGIYHNERDGFYFHENMG